MEYLQREILTTENLYWSTLENIFDERKVINARRSTHRMGAPVVSCFFMVITGKLEANVFYCEIWYESDSTLFVFVL